MNNKRPYGFKVKVLSRGLSVTAKPDENLAGLLSRARIPLNTSCGGKGVCGNCFVEIVKGHLPDPGEDERALLGRKKLKGRFRLACRFRIGAPLEIRVPDSSLVREIRVLEAGPKTDIPVDPAVKKIYLDLGPADFSSDASFLDIIQDRQKRHGLTAPLGLLNKMKPWLEGDSSPALTAVVHRGREILDLEPGDSSSSAFGVAVDLGTTTLVAALVDIISGETLAVRTDLNRQILFGADVVSRIAAAMENQEIAADLKNIVVEALNRMIGSLLKDCGRDASRVYEVVIAGNTVMNHLLLGLPVRSLAYSPFRALFTRLPGMNAADIGLDIHPRGKIYFSPNIRSFIGGDISAGIMASGLSGKEGNVLFIDLGTNGEIVLKTSNKWTATSTAAGPAFEGAGISHGMPALPGAIHRAGGKKNMTVRTLGDLPAAGICGTGLIDVIAFYLRNGALASNGRIRNDSKKLVVTKGLSLHQEDIRQVQLAVAAVKAGVRILLGESGLGANELNGLVIAGAFGRDLDIRNAQAIGLLPDINRQKIDFVGNSSLAGAKLFLLNAEARKRAESLVSRIRFRSMVKDPRFQEEFVKALEFGLWT